MTKVVVNGLIGKRVYGEQLQHKLAPDSKLQVDAAASAFRGRGAGPAGGGSSTGMVWFSAATLGLGLSTAIEGVPEKLQEGWEWSCEHPFSVFWILVGAWVAWKILCGLFFLFTDKEMRLALRAIIIAYSQVIWSYLTCTKMDTSEEFIFLTW